MPFHEKSAWVMAIALLTGGVIYFGMVGALTTQTGSLAAPTIPQIAIYTAVLVLIAIVGHIIAALAAPHEADAPTDERDKRIFDRAGNLSGYVVGAGTILSLGLYLVFNDGNLLFYGVFASLMSSQLAEYVAQIVLYRSAI